MTRDDITRMAREAGLFVPHAGIPENGALTRFAALVAERDTALLRHALEALELCIPLGSDVTADLELTKAALRERLGEKE